MNEMSDDITESRLLKAPENKLDFQPYDIYRKLTKKERAEMQKQIQANTVKYAAELDDKVLPTMPNTKKATVLGKRRFLGIVAERNARLQAQIDWLHSEQEKHRRLEEDAV